MTEHTASRLRHLASPRSPQARSRGRQAGALLLRLGCVALLAWIGYIHLHLWQEGYRHIPTNGPLFLLDAVLGPKVKGKPLKVHAAFVCVMP